MSPALPARAGLAAAVTAAFQAVGGVVIPARWIARPDPVLDPATATPVERSIRLIWLAALPEADEDPIRPPAPRLALLAPGDDSVPPPDDQPPPRANDRLILAGTLWRIIDAADRSAGLGLLFRARLRPLGPDADEEEPPQP